MFAPKYTGTVKFLVYVVASRVDPQQGLWFQLEKSIPSTVYVPPPPPPPPPKTATQIERDQAYEAYSEEFGL